MEVVTGAQAVQKLIQILNESALSGNQADPLMIALNAASDSFDRGNPRAGVNQLKAFQNKVRAQLSPDNRPLAIALIQAVQKIIDRFAGSER